MDTIKIHDKFFTPFIDAKKIDAVVKKVAEDILNDLKGEQPVFIGILNGSFMFIADFVRHYQDECQVSFVKLSSYQGTTTTGKVKELVGIQEDLEGKTVVILEDIIDTGNTLEEIYKIFEDKKVKTLKIATLFFKPEIFKKDLKIDYIGLSIPNKFIVGYGLDYDGLGRNLSDIYQLKTTTN
jgi:adenylate kinase